MHVNVHGGAHVHSATCEGQRSTLSFGARGFLPLKQCLSLTWTVAIEAGLPSPQASLNLSVVSSHLAITMITGVPGFPHL